eukprot:467219-Pyramimonas_sp.AAC.1
MNYTTTRRNGPHLSPRRSHIDTPGSSFASSEHIPKLLLLRASRCSGSIAVCGWLVRRRLLSRLIIR